MPTVLLLRHGRTTANASGVLAGWTSGVTLDDTGRAQAAAAGARLAAVPLVALVTSPLERCRETVALVQHAARQTPPPTRGRRAAPTWPDSEPTVDERLGECRYGDWEGRSLRELARQPLWRIVQAHPSAAVFPGDGGEPLAATAARAVAAVREWDATVARTHGPDAVWLACTHGDVIKAIVADALGLHLDLFQRIVVDPGSVTAIRYTETRPFLLRLNDTGGDYTSLRPQKRRSRRRSQASDSDAVVGGGAGDGRTM